MKIDVESRKHVELGSDFENRIRTLKKKNNETYKKNLLSNVILSFTLYKGKGRSGHVRSLG